MNRQILENIRQLKRQLIPNERLILFGSQARGDDRPDSDWDLLLLLKNNQNKIDFEDKIYDMVLMGSKFNTYLSIKTYTEKEWEIRKPSLFYKNVERDKIEIV
jgi:predicted nucleotidyltransferase